MPKFSQTTLRFFDFSIAMSHNRNIYTLLCYSDTRTKVTQALRRSQLIEVTSRISIARKPLFSVPSIVPISMSGTHYTCPCVRLGILVLSVFVVSSVLRKENIALLLITHLA